MEQRIDKILKKVKERNIQDGFCFWCGKGIEDKNKKKKYHPECVYDAKRFGIKAKFKNHTYMHLYLGTGYARGQGKRSGGMIKGSMSVAQDMWSSPVPVTLENVLSSLKYHQYRINLCNGAWVDKEDAIILAKYLDSCSNVENMQVSPIGEL